MNPQRLHVIYEPNADGTYTAYTVISAGCTSATGLPGTAPAAPQILAPQVGDFGPALSRVGTQVTAPAKAETETRVPPQPLGSASTTIDTDRGPFKIDDPRLLYLVIARTNVEGKKVSKQAADAIVKALKLKSSTKSRGQFMRKPGDGVKALDNYWYFRFTAIDKHDAEAPKLTFCVHNVEKMGGCRVYLIAQDMSKRAAHGKYKDVAPLQATGAPKATK